MRNKTSLVPLSPSLYAWSAERIALFAAGVLLLLAYGCEHEANSAESEARALSVQSGPLTDTIRFQDQDYYVEPFVQVGASSGISSLSVNGANVVFVDSAFALLNSRPVVMYVPATEENTVYLREVFLDTQGNTEDLWRILEDELLYLAITTKTPIFPPKDNTPPPTTKSMGIDWKH